MLIVLPAMRNLDFDMEIFMSRGRDMACSDIKHVVSCFSGYRTMLLSQMGVFQKDDPPTIL